MALNVSARHGRQTGDQSQLFYLINLEKRIPHAISCAGNRIVTRVLADLREKLKPFYSEAGQPSIDRSRRQDAPITRGSRLIATAASDFFRELFEAVVRACMVACKAKDG